MALPKITQPEFEITLPVIKKKIKFRPFLVREEKVLLVGKEGSSSEQLNAMIQIVEDVVLTKNFNARDLTAVDLEYLFMHLRARSVNNVVKLKYKDTDDESIYDFELDLYDLEPTFNEDRSNVVDIGNYKVELLDPTLKILEQLDMDMNDAKTVTTSDDVSPEQVDSVFNLLAHCLVKVYDDKEVYDDFTVQEAKEWFQSVDIKSFEAIQTFFETAPKLQHTFEYVNKNKKNRSITLSGIQDFF